MDSYGSIVFSSVCGCFCRTKSVNPLNVSDFIHVVGFRFTLVPGGRRCPLRSAIAPLSSLRVSQEHATSNTDSKLKTLVWLHTGGERTRLIDDNRRNYSHYAGR